MITSLPRYVSHEMWIDETISYAPKIPFGINYTIEHVLSTHFGNTFLTHLLLENVLCVNKVLFKGADKDTILRVHAETYMYKLPTIYLEFLTNEFSYICCICHIDSVRAFTNLGHTYLWYIILALKSAPAFLRHTCRYSNSLLNTSHKLYSPCTSCSKGTGASLWRRPLISSIGNPPVAHRHPPRVFQQAHWVHT